MDFLGLSKELCDEHYGLETCCTKYGQVTEEVLLTLDHEEFAEWHLDVRLCHETVKILCCPEDVFCVGTASHD